MRIQALNDFAPRWWTPPGQDRDAGEVSFFIRPLDGEQHALVAEHVRTIDGKAAFSAAGVKVGLRYGLVGWRGLVDGEGEELEHAAHEHKRLPFDVRSMIFAKILEISRLDEDEAKNFESRSRSVNTGTDSSA